MDCTRSGEEKTLPSSPSLGPPRRAQVLLSIPGGRIPFAPAGPGYHALPKPREWLPPSPPSTPPLHSHFPTAPPTHTHPAEVAPSGESSGLECSSAVLFFLGYSRGCGNSHRCGEGKPHLPSPAAGKGERPRRPGPGLVQPLWSLGPVG